MYYKDLEPCHYRTKKDDAPTAVGWLDARYGYEKGSVPAAALAKLKSLPTTNQTRGMHTCDRCGKARSSNEIHVPGKGGKTYASPRMIIHYIEEHGYRPPQEYLDALMAMDEEDDKEDNRADAVYESVIKRIEDGVVTADDFNKLVEATDKSTKERVHRRTRKDTAGPTAVSMMGRVVPKKTGNNDPPRQGRGKRFAAGTPAKERQNAQQRRDHAGDSSARLTEAVRSILGSNGGDASGLVIGPASDVRAIRAAASALLVSQDSRDELARVIGEDISGDWLYSVVMAADARLLADGERPEDGRPVTLVVERSGRPPQEKGHRGHAPTDDGDEEGDKPASNRRVKEKETRDYQATGLPRQLDELEKLLKWMEWCGSIGHSGNAKVFIDGDGAAHLKFKGVSAEVPGTSESDVELKIGID